MNIKENQKKGVTFTQVVDIIIKILSILLIIGVIAFFAETLIRIFPDFDPDSPIDTPSFGIVVSVLLPNILGVIVVGTAINYILKYTTYSDEMQKSAYAMYLFLSTSITLVGFILVLISWIVLTVYLSSVQLLPIFIVTSFVPFIVLFLWLLLVSSGYNRVKKLGVSFKELMILGKEEYRRIRVEKVRQKITDKYKISSKISEQRNKNNTGISISQKNPEHDRLQRFEQIIIKTKEMKLSDLGALLEFEDKQSLMRWLYDLNENQKFTISGDNIIFEK